MAESDALFGITRRARSFGKRRARPFVNSATILLLIRHRSKQIDHWPSGTRPKAADRHNRGASGDIIGRVQGKDLLMHGQIGVDTQDVIPFARAVKST